MGKIKVLATSTSCLDYYPYKHDIGIVRIKVIINGSVYEDGLDMKADEFYKLLREDKDLLPTTSQPSVGELIEKFEKLYEDGYDEVFIVTIASNLSGSFNSISVAAKEMADKMKITVFDSKTVFAPEGEMAVLADKMFKEGKTTEEVVDTLTKMRDKITILFVCEDLNNLIKNGRLTGAKAFFGKLLKIKPVLQVNGAGQIVSVDKQRTTQKAMESLTDIAAEFISGKKARIINLYSKEEILHKLSAHIKGKLGITAEYDVPASPVVGTHIGPHVAGIAIILE